MNKAELINLAYLAAGVLFILGLKGLTHPRTAVRGNFLGAIGMLVAVVATLVHQEVVSYGYIIAGLLIGSAIGVVFAVRIQMTAMPQMVALLNGFGGIASVFVAGAELMKPVVRAPTGGRVLLGEVLGIQAETTIVSPTTDQLIAAAATGLIGAVTFWGSLVAFSKLQELWFKKPVYFGGQQLVNAALAVATVILAAWMVADPGNMIAYWLLVGVASALGVLLVIPIGGADMPVVIALLNSYSGIAAAASGFVLGNSVLIVAGSLVGASGIILTQIMCKAMNRSLFNVLFGVLGPSASAPSADDVYAGRVKSTSPDEVALLYDGIRRAVIVPGYGLAVAQAQHAVRELSNQLQARGVEVEFAIHPVAGRMPGHMNVLLAEANIPYEQLKEMDEINPSFSQTDVVLIIGANDVVNPAARTDPSSPIYGMPILNVDEARTVIVLKRSLSPGFAGIPNPLFAADNCLMLFADAKQGVLDIITAIKES